MSLMLVGVFLAVVGSCDLMRAARDRVGPARQTLIVVIGALLFAGFFGWAGESHKHSIVVGIALSVALAMWVVGSSAALASGPSARVWRAVAFVGLGGGVVVGLLGTDALPIWLDWPDRLKATVFATWPVPDVTVSAGAVLLQLATGNLVVRLLLDAVGVPASSNEKTLKGGRLLGPMERIFILGLGHMGELTAAAIVVAAKGLLRFPELQAGAKEGPSDVTEYFLIGSFASWMIGLAGVSLIYLA